MSCGQIGKSEGAGVGVEDVGGFGDTAACVSQELRRDKYGVPGFR